LTALERAATYRVQVRRALLLVVLLATRARGGQDAAVAHRPLDYHADVQPIFARRCQPCHFPGGKMYAALPFDQARTIIALDAKLFTRIKAEEDRAVIRRFLAERATR
jgi:hypothetical protein